MFSPNLTHFSEEVLNESEIKEVLVYAQNFNRMRSEYKINELHNNISGCCYSIILGTETNWNDEVKSELVFNNRYSVFRSDRDLLLSNKKSGGGVLIAIEIQYDSDLIETKKYKEFEDVWVKVTLNKESHIFASVYFPPEFAKKESYELFLNTAESVIKKMKPETKIHIYGDFNQNNVDFIADEDNESLLLPIVGENETLQYIFDKTSQLGLYQVNHIKNDQNCFLDLLFTNCTEDFCVDKAVSPLWKNEKFHTAIEYSLFIFLKRSHSKDYDFEYVYDFRKCNYEAIEHRLSNINWQSLLKDDQDINKAVDAFYYLVYNLFDEFVPKTKKRISTSNKYPVWFTQHIKNLKNKKQKCHKMYKKHKTPEYLNKYKYISTELDAEISSAYENYNIRVESDIKSNPKGFFKFANSKMKSSNFPSRMVFEHSASADPKEICNQFAKFFQSVYKTTEGSHDFDYFSYLPDKLNNISASQITENEILAALEGLDVSKGPGPDEIPPIIMKTLASSFVIPLYLLFNWSLQLGQFPLTWKKSFLIPIFKSGQRAEIKNYRGIAIISCIPKLFEAIINQKIFTQVRNSIVSNQHGFFKGRSTSTNLLEFVNFALVSMDRGNSVETLYTDFSKAFDRVDIPMLIFKLKRMGFDTQLIKWIESYLTDRTQIVRFKSCYSDLIKVTSGVPQGSHLGPLLFILFVNDVTLVLNNLKVLIYADDMKLFMEISKHSDFLLFQQEVDIFYKWCVKSLLDINVKKCNVISYSRKNVNYSFDCTLGQQPVKRCDKIRDLGVILDRKLTFTDHYNITIHKANSMLGFIKRFSYHFNDPYTIKTLYITYVRSILEYCSIVWAPYQAVHNNRIESVQKQFLLFALRKLGWASHSLPSYESRCLLIDIETLEKRREINMMSFVNDIVSQRIDSEYLLQNLNFNAPMRSLRKRNIFVLNLHRTLYAQNGPVNRMMKIYNQHCEMIDLTMSRNVLKKTLKTIYS